MSLASVQVKSSTSYIISCFLEQGVFIPATCTLLLLSLSKLDTSITRNQQAYMSKCVLLLAMKIFQFLVDPTTNQFLDTALFEADGLEMDRRVQVHLH